MSGSAWALSRGEGSSSLASGGQLGGSQAGVRIFYNAGTPALALTARISADLSHRTGREAALGFALRGHNLGLIVEQRIALSRGGRSAPAMFAYGGVSNVQLAERLTIDGYLQAGLVGISPAAAFIDGSARLERHIFGSGQSTLGIGAGIWAAAQPGASRVDVGPQVVAHLPLAKTNLRVSAEWRQRVAGNAAPSSGPNVTVGFDF